MNFCYKKHYPLATNSRTGGGINNLQKFLMNLEKKVVNN
jgi:hypothetical protein